MESCHLEGLPSEIKTLILYHISDLTSLRCLVHASPLFHAVYMSQRKRVLSSVLEKCLQIPVLVDAIAALVALRGREERKRVFIPARKALDDFLAQYHPLRSVLNAPVSLEEHEYKGPEVDIQYLFLKMTEDDLIEMARLHTSILFLTSEIAKYFVEHIPHTNVGDAGDLALSLHESCRIQRALYRVEILHLIFNTHELKSNYYHDAETQRRLPSGEKNFSSGDSFDLFLIIYSPWEVEEIKCILDYLYEVYDTLPGASDWESEMDKIYDPENVREFVISDDYRHYVMGFGLGFLHHWITVSQIPEPDERLAKQTRMVGGKLTWMADNYVDDALRIPPPDDEYNDYYTHEADGKTFTSDADHNSPNLAWTWAVEGENGEAFVDILCTWHSELRDWGWVFWGGDRLRGWDVEGVVKKEYEWVHRESYIERMGL